MVWRGAALLPDQTSMAQNFDRRRVNGPEDSAPPVFADDDDDDEYAAWAAGDARIGRAAGDIRPICACATGKSARCAHPSAQSSSRA
jgi:hypothetical protein